MPYATQADMIDAFGEREVIALTDRDNLGTIDASVLGKALANAAGEIDRYLVGRYPLPLANAPQILTTYCCDIARYRLCGTDVAETEAARTRYKDAIRFLEAVRDGKIKLGVEVAGAPDPSANLATVVTGSGIFSRRARGC